VLGGGSKAAVWVQQVQEGYNNLATARKEVADVQPAGTGAVHLFWAVVRPVWKVLQPRNEAVTTCITAR
jgi:hypothetical protein